MLFSTQYLGVLLSKNNLKRKTFFEITLRIEFETQSRIAKELKKANVIVLESELVSVIFFSIKVHVRIAMFNYNFHSIR